LRALGVTTAARASALPDIPIIGDFVPGYEVSAWYGLGAPRDTPAAIVDTLAKSMKAVLNDPAVKGRLVSFGSSAFALGPAELGTFIGAETDRWAKVIRSENIKTD
jgi:tripartite-type tricarboxylate transporter receptor subunit TctC